MTFCLPRAAAFLSLCILSLCFKSASQAQIVEVVGSASSAANARTPVIDDVGNVFYVNGTSFVVGTPATPIQRTVLPVGSVLPNGSIVPYTFLNSGTITYVGNGGLMQSNASRNVTIAGVSQAAFGLSSPPWKYHSSASESYDFGVSPDGDVSFRVAITSNNLFLNQTMALYSGSPTNLTLLMDSTHDAPGMPGFRPNMNGYFHSARNTNGVSVFTGLVSANGLAPACIWTHDVTNGIQLAVYGSFAGGTPIPGVSGGTFNAINFSIEQWATIDDEGRIAFSAQGYANPKNISGIYGGFPNNLQPIATNGLAVPGIAGATFDSFASSSTPRLGADGQMVFTAAIKGTGINSTNSQVLVVGSSVNDLKVLAQSGTPAPGMPAGVYWDMFILDNSPAFEGNAVYNNRRFVIFGTNRVAILGQVVGSGIISAGSVNANDSGLWITDDSGNLALVARRNSSLTTSTGSITPTNYFVMTGGSGRDGRPTAGNRAGQLTFMNGAKTYRVSPGTIAATFGLTTNVSPANSGSITVDPSGSSFASNTIVTLTAVAAIGEQFVGWSGDASGSINPIQVTMDSAKTVTALFTNIVVGPSFTLTTNVSPAGSGSINVDPPGSTFASNTVVTLTATPAAGKLFVRWTGAVATNVNPLSITMSTNKSVTAVFTNAPLYFVLTTNINPQGLGTLSASPAPATNGYAAGTIVTLTATPNTGARFVKWNGASIALTNRIKLTMTTNKTVTAWFTNLAKFTLNLTLSPTNAGMVIKSPAPVSGNDYYTGTVVTLTPVAQTGFKFLKWTGSLIGTANPARVTMTANKTIAGVFTTVPTFQLSVAANPSDAGYVLASPSPATNGYSSNAVVTLTAVANGTNQFAAWSGVSGLSNNVNVTMKSNKTVTAIFNTPGKIYWQSTNSFVSLWFMQNSNYVTSALLNNGKAISKAWRLAGTVDFDENGSKDLLFQNNNGAVMLWMMTNNFIVRTQTLKTAPLGIRLVGAGNFSTNTSPDLLWQNNASGALMLWTFNGTNYSGSQSITSSNAPGTAWKAIAVADFNNDGQADIVLQHTDGRVMLWLMNGSTMSSSVILNGGLAATTGWKVAGVSDLDDNGTPDILFQVTDGKSAVWEMDGTNKLSESFIANSGIMPVAWTLRAGK